MNTGIVDDTHWECMLRGVVGYIVDDTHWECMVGGVVGYIVDDAHWEWVWWDALWVSTLGVYDEGFGGVYCGLYILGVFLSWCLEGEG